MLWRNIWQASIVGKETDRLKDRGSVRCVERNSVAIVCFLVLMLLYAFNAWGSFPVLKLTVTWIWPLPAEIFMSVDWTEDNCTISPIQTLPELKSIRLRIIRLMQVLNKVKMEISKSAEFLFTGMSAMGPKWLRNSYCCWMWMSTVHTFWSTSIHA
jgi:hypothetical protein